MRPFALALCGALCIQGCTSASQSAASSSAPGSAAVEVSVIRIAPQNVVQTADYLALILPIQSASVRPEISGLIRRKLFKDGEVVRAGRPLYEVDSSALQAGFEQAKANRIGAAVAFEAAETKQARLENLARASIASQQDVDDATTNAKQLHSSLKQAQSLESIARINLQNALIRAPISGRAGVSAVSIGDLVQTNQSSSLVDIKDGTTVYAEVSGPYSELAKFAGAQGKSVLVALTGSAMPRNAKLAYLGPGPADPQTWLMRIEIANADGHLDPGQYVHCQVLSPPNDQAIVVPKISVMRLADGSPYVFVALPGGKTTLRTIALGAETQADYVVTSGLNKGDLVIVNGAQKVAPGQFVKLNYNVRRS